MVISCAYPGCFNIKKPKRKFSPEKKILTFHRFPIHNPERLKLWLLALHLDINTPEHTLIFKRVCSDHFFDHDFKPSQQRKSPFSERVGSGGGPGSRSIYCNKCIKSTIYINNLYSVNLYKPNLIHVISQPPVYNQPEQTEEQFEESLELDVSMLSIDPPSDKKDLSFQPLSSTSTSAPSTEDEECEMHWKQIKWIVNEPNVMELFKRCQECGSVITKTRKATVGSVLRVHWECEKNHKGKWSSCTDVRGICAPCQDTRTIESCSHGYEIFATIYGIALQLVEVTLT
uniref:THAP-type domain-containing protein n=1 Tax=Sinocyclocheilus grahami TaxID=75366 RepID=A0A672MWR3_SINGR